MRTESGGYQTDGSKTKPKPPGGGVSSKATRKKDIEKAVSALEQISLLSQNALHISGHVYDDMKQPRYEDEYAALLLCYGELTGMIKLIHETADTARKGLAEG